MQEAFGPHTDFHIYQPKPKYDLADRLVIGSAIATFAVVIIVALLEAFA